MDTWLLVTAWVVLGVAAFAVLVGAFLTRRPLRRLLGSGLQGVLALMAVNLLAGLTQVSLGFSYLSVWGKLCTGHPRCCWAVADEACASCGCILKKSCNIGNVCYNGGATHLYI